MIKKILPLLLCLIISVAAYADEKEDFTLMVKMFNDELYGLVKERAENFFLEYPNSIRAYKVYLLLGRSRYELKEYKEAIKALQKVASTPTSADGKDEALYWISESYLQLKDYALAISYYDKLLNHYPKSKLAPLSKYSIGWSLEGLGSLEDARKNYEELVVVYPDSQYVADSLFRMGKIDFERRDWNGSVISLERFVQQFPIHHASPEAHYLLGEAYFNSKDYPKSLENFKRVMASGKEGAFYAYVLHGIAWAYFQLEQYEESLQAFTPFLDELRENPIGDSFHFGRARALHKLKRYNEAISAYEDFLMSFKDSDYVDDVMFWMGSLYYARQNYPKSVEVWEGMLQTFPQSHLRAEAQYQLAWAHFKMRDDIKAMKYLQVIKEASGDELLIAAAYCRIGDMLLENNKIEAAIAEYDTVLKEFSESLYCDHAQYQIATAFMNLGNLEAAALGFQSLISNYPSSLYVDDALYALGFVYLKQGDVQLALTTFRDFIRSFPESRYKQRAFYQIAVCHINLDHHEEAISILNELELLQSKHDLALAAKYQKAILLFRQGKDMEALESIQEILDEHPKSRMIPDVLIFLSDYYFDRGQYEKSASVLNQFDSQLSKHSLADEALLRIGESYERRGYSKDAMRYYEKIVDGYLDSNSTPLALKNWVRILSSSQKRRAIDKFSHLKTLAKTPSSLQALNTQLGFIRREMGEIRKSIRNFQEALKLANKADAAVLVYEIAKCKELLGAVDEAIAEFLKVGYKYPSQNKIADDARQNAARLLESQGRLDEAQKILNSFNATDIDSMGEE